VPKNKNCQHDFFQNYYNNYCHLTASFLGQPGKPAPERQTILDFNEVIDNGVTVTSAEPYADR